MTDELELEQVPFWSLARSLSHAKPRALVVKMLDADHPLTKEDKAALAVGIRCLGQDKSDLMRKPDKHDRGRKPTKKFSDEWYFGQAVKEVRELAAKHKRYQGDVLDLVAALWKIRGWLRDDEHGPYRDPVKVDDKLEWRLSERNPNPPSLFEKYRDRVMTRLHIGRAAPEVQTYRDLWREPECIEVWFWFNERHIIMLDTEAEPPDAAEYGLRRFPVTRNFLAKLNALTRGK